MSGKPVGLLDVIGNERITTAESMADHIHPQPPRNHNTHGIEEYL